MRIFREGIARAFVSTLLSFSVAYVFVPCALCARQSTSSPQGDVSPFRLIRSTSGSKEVTKGTQETIEDPRTVFHAPEDNQVVVVFELEGPTGVHHVQGHWRNPEGKVVSVGDVDMETHIPRFSCYFSLTFPESVTPGLWAIEVEVDGHPSAVHTFQIVSDAKPSPPPPASPPPAADVYRGVVAASVFIDNQDSTGQLVRQGSGFFIDKGVLVTAFQVIDGASSLQIEFPDGSRANTDQVLAWNRRQDWAVLRVDAPKVSPLERAQTGSWKVGDVCYQLDSPNEGSRTIQNVGITGIEESAVAGERLNTSWTSLSRSIGSPLLDTYGRVIGVLGGSLVPGAESINRAGAREFMQGGAAPEGATNRLVVPISLIPTQFDSRQPATLDALAAQGLFVEPITSDTQVISATLCKNYQREGQVALFPQNATFEFSRGRDALVIVATWAPDKKIKSTLQFRIYDTDNHLVGESRPEKIDLQPQVTAYSGIKLSTAPLPPGTYRIDLLLGDVPQWRSFFQVRE